MASSHRSFAAALLFVMLFMATEVGRNTIIMVAEAKNCDTPSAIVQGRCPSDATCRDKCQKFEDSIDGHCVGKVSAKCMCVKPC